MVPIRAGPHTTLQIMNKRACLSIASRIDSGLIRELGQGIDLGRMIGEPLYARDVLLVCDAFANVSESDLATLSKQYRRAAAEEAPADTGADSGGFSPSRFFNSLFGAFLSSEQALQHAKPQARQRGGLRRWRTPGSR